MPNAMENHLAFWAVLARCCDGAVEKDGGLTMITTGLPIPFFNPSMPHLWPDDPVAMTARIRDFSGRHGGKSMIATWGEIATMFAPVARQLELIDDGTTPEMIMFRDDHGFPVYDRRGYPHVTDVQRWSFA